MSGSDKTLLFSITDARLYAFTEHSHLSWVDYFQVGNHAAESVDNPLIRILKEKKILSDNFPFDTVHITTDKSNPIESLLEQIRKFLQSGATLSIPVVSNSMAPLFKSGDLVVISNDSTEYPIKGEIVALFDIDGFLIHRLVEIIKKDSQLYCVTKADSTTETDRPRPIHFFVGVIKEKISAKSQQREYLPSVEPAGIHLSHIHIWQQVRAKLKWGLFEFVITHQSGAWKSLWCTWYRWHEWVVTTLQAKYDYSAILFGSYTQNRFIAGASDIDLLIIFKDDQDISITSEIARIATWQKRVAPLTPLLHVVWCLPRSLYLAIQNLGYVRISNPGPLIFLIDNAQIATALNPQDTLEESDDILSRVREWMQQEKHLRESLLEHAQIDDTYLQGRKRYLQEKLKKNCLSFLAWTKLVTGESYALSPLELTAQSIDSINNAVFLKVTDVFPSLATSITSYYQHADNTHIPRWSSFLFSFPGWKHVTSDVTLEPVAGLRLTQIMLADQILSVMTYLQYPDPLQLHRQLCRLVVIFGFYTEGVQIRFDGLDAPLLKSNVATALASKLFSSVTVDLNDDAVRLAVDRFLSRLSVDLNRTQQSAAILGYSM